MLSAVMGEPGRQQVKASRRWWCAAEGDHPIAAASCLLGGTFSPCFPHKSTGIRPSRWQWGVRGKGASACVPVDNWGYTATHPHIHQAVLEHPPPLPNILVNLLPLPTGQSPPGNKLLFPLITRIQRQINEMAGNREAWPRPNELSVQMKSQNCSSVSKQQGFEHRTLNFHWYPSCQLCSTYISNLGQSTYVLGTSVYSSCRTKRSHEPLHRLTLEFPN